MQNLICLFLLLISAVPASAQQSERFGPYEVHYSIVNTTFLDPVIASRYQIVRGSERAIINIAVREHLEDGATVARSAKLEGRTWDLFQNQFLAFREIREGEAIYYIAGFEFSHEELRFFDVQLLPEGANRSRQLKFQRMLYVD